MLKELIKWAIENNIPVKKFIPDWSKGKSAGFITNKEMGIYADKAIVIHNGSSGSKDMISYMNKLKKPCIVLEIKN